MCGLPSIPIICFCLRVTSTLIHCIETQIEKLKPIAAKLGTTLAVLSIAWCLHNPHVSTVITGASRPSQVEENLKALDVVKLLTPEILAEIDEAAGTKPKLTFDFGRGSLRVL